MPKNEVLAQYDKLRGEVMGAQPPITERNFIQIRSFGRATVSVVNFDALPGYQRSIAEALYDLYESARKRSDRKAIGTAKRLFSERVGFSAAKIFDMIHKRPKHRALLDRIQGLA